MPHRIVLDDQVRRTDGVSPAIDIAFSQDSALLLTLAITQILEQESLSLTIEGSADEETWLPVAELPVRNYCGTYETNLDLREQPGIRFIRVRWMMRRWGSSEATPLFRFAVSVRPVVPAPAAAAAAAMTASAG